MDGESYILDVSGLHLRDRARVLVAVHFRDPRIVGEVRGEVGVGARGVVRVVSELDGR